MKNRGFHFTTYWELRFFAWNFFKVYMVEMIKLEGGCMRERAFSSLLVCLLFFTPQVFSKQITNSDSLLLRTEVSLAVRVDPLEVPLNRDLQCIIEISWEGDLDLIEIGDLEEPLFTNFTVEGSRSANRVIGVAGGRRAYKEIVYILKPVNLGMGYIESTTLSYEDKTTGKSHSIRTQRIGAEVISAGPEPGERKKWWIYLLPVAVILTFIPLILQFIRKRKSRQEVEAEAPPIEETYLHQLKETVDLKQDNKTDALSVLTKLFRHYLQEKYDIPALEATTKDLINIVNEQPLEDNWARRCKNLFENADIVRFSGQEASQSELDEAYTIVENILESNLRKARERLESEKEKGARKNIFRK
jgi:hypothetical protein